MAKPFNPRELVARINAVLRRQAPLEAPGSTCQRRDRHLRPLLAEPGNAQPDQGRCARGHDKTEFGLLKVLAQHPAYAAVARQIDRIGARPNTKNLDRAIDVQVSRLRNSWAKTRSIRASFKRWGLRVVRARRHANNAK